MLRRSGGLVVYSAVAIAFIWLAWQVLLAGTARVPPAADALAGTSVAAPTGTPELMRLAERHLAQAEPGTIDWQPIERAARQALRHQPLEHRALVLLALAADARGQDAAALRLMELAARRSLRDAPVHLWMADRRLRQQDYEAALHHADVVMRMGRGTRDEIFPALVAMARHAESLPMLVAALEEAPPWRGRLLGALVRGDDPAAALPLLIALQESRQPPTRRELGLLVDRLVRGGRYGQAYLVWQRFLPQERRADQRYLHNGDFAAPITNLAFDWEIGAPRGAEIDVVEDEGLRRLRIAFGRGRVRFDHVSKLLVLPPGTYRLTGAAEASDFGNSRGLRWRLHCVEGVDLAATEPLAGTVSRHRFEQVFSVPARDCRAQRLRLELPARAAREREVEGGAVWYDSLDLRRVDWPMVEGAATP